MKAGLKDLQGTNWKIHASPSRFGQQDQVVSRVMKAVTETEDGGEGSAGIEPAPSGRGLRIRTLLDLLKRGVSVTDVRLIQDTEENWTIWVRLSDRTGEHRINMTRFDSAKTYKDLGLAVHTVWADFNYMGTIALISERRRLPRPRTRRTAKTT